MTDNSKTPSNNSMLDTGVPDFFDCLICESAETVRKMGDSAKALAAATQTFADAIIQQAETTARMIEGARQYRGEQRKLADALAGLAQKPEPIIPPKPVTGVIPSGQVSIRDRVLNRYSDTGIDHRDIAMEFNLIPASVNQWLKDAREKLDSRVIRGDALLMENEKKEEFDLRAEFVNAGAVKHDIVFPQDTDIGLPIAKIYPATGDITSKDGTANIPPYWTTALSELLDQRKVDGKHLVTAGNFPSELAILRELRTVNERLREAKLYILCDGSHYQLCRLL